MPPAANAASAEETDAAMARELAAQFEQEERGVSLNPSSGPTDPPVPPRVERFGCRATVSFEFFRSEFG